MSKLRERLNKFKARRWKTQTIDGLGSFAFRSLVEGERAQVEAAAGLRLLVKRLVIIFSCCDPETQIPLYPTLDEFPKDPAARSIDDHLEDLALMDAAIVDSLSTPGLSLARISAEDMKTLLGEPDASS